MHGFCGDGGGRGVVRGGFVFLLGTNDAVLGVSLMGAVFVMVRVGVSG